MRARRAPRPPPPYPPPAQSLAIAPAIQTGSDFKAARERLGISRETLSQLLGLGRATVARYQKPGYPIPRQTALAMEALAKRLVEADCPPGRDYRIGSTPPPAEITE